MRFFWAGEPGEFTVASNGGGTAVDAIESRVEGRLTDRLADVVRDQAAVVVVGKRDRQTHGNKAFVGVRVSRCSIWDLNAEQQRRRCWVKVVRPVGKTVEESPHIGTRRVQIRVQVQTRNTWRVPPLPRKARRELRIERINPVWISNAKVHAADRSRDHAYATRAKSKLSLTD